jgi:predicted nuclease of predicted toxin-antitoxin system
MAYPSNQPDEDVQFIFDECVTPRLVRKASDFGYYGIHVAAVGMASASDDLICARAIESRRILVTNNGRDFRRLYRRFRHHPGLLILLPSVGWQEQVALFEKLLRFIENEDKVVDRVVEIRRDGHITIQPWTVDTP